MPDFREMFTEADLPEFVKLLNSFNGPMPMFATLTPSEQCDVVEGRCTYRQHEHTPILDYRPTEYQRLNFGELD